VFVFCFVVCEQATSGYINGHEHSLDVERRVRGKVVTRTINRIQLTARETGIIGFLKMLQNVPLGQAYS